ncbi:MAG: hypothetical protein QXM12_07090, partial [Nitrososphaerota archaeon]
GVGKQIQKSKESEVEDEAKQVDVVKLPVVDLDIRPPALLYGTVTQPTDIHGKVFEEWFSGTPAGAIVNVLDMPTQAVLKGYTARLEEHEGNPLAQSVLSLGAGLAVGVTSLVSPKQWVESVGVLAKPQQVVEEVSKSPHTSIPFIVGSAVSSAVVTGLVTSKLAPKTTTVKEVEFVSPKLSEISLGIYDDVFYGKQVYKGTGWVRGTSQPEYLYVVKESPSGKVTYVQEPGKMLVAKTEGGGGKALMVEYEVRQSLLDKLRGQVKVTEKTYYVHEGITPDDFIKYKQMITDTKQYHALKALGVEEVDVKTPKTDVVDLTKTDFTRFSGVGQVQTQVQTPKAEVKTIQVPITESPTISTPVLQTPKSEVRTADISNVGRVVYYADIDVVSYPSITPKSVTSMSSPADSAVVSVLTVPSAPEPPEHLALSRSATPEPVAVTTPIISESVVAVPESPTPKGTEVVGSQVRFDVFEVSAERFVEVPKSVTISVPAVDEVVGITEKKAVEGLTQEVQTVIKEEAVPVVDVGQVQQVQHQTPRVNILADTLIKKSVEVPDFRRVPTGDELIRAPLTAPTRSFPSPPGGSPGGRFDIPLRPLVGGGAPLGEGKIFKLPKSWTFRQRINPWEYRLNVITRKFEKSLRGLGL